MATFTSYDPGTPNWVDLMTSDVDGAKVFYETVFGWDTEDQLDDEGNRIYVMCRLDGKDVAGIGGQPPDVEGMPTVWNTYVSVADVDAAIAVVTGAGGQVMMPAMDVVTAGRMAVCADPTGAAFSLWQAGDHFGSGVVNEPNTFAWNELMTRDVETARDFYSKVFGWSYDLQDMGPMGTYTVISGGENGGLGGMMSMPDEMPDMVPNHWMVYFTVTDVDASVSAVTGAGGQVVNGPMDVPGVGRMVTVHDPAGGSFSMMQPAAAE